MAEITSIELANLMRDIWTKELQGVAEEAVREEVNNTLRDEIENMIYRHVSVLTRSAVDHWVREEVEKLMRDEWKITIDVTARTKGLDP